jgi:hypothetical protein
LNFFNPYILFGLIAVAVPILLHILNLQKVRKMEFSTLMFLKEVQKSRFRRIRIKQWPLMLTRILIITFLVLTFADFFIEGYSAGGKDVTKLGLIFTDSSYSMNISDGQDSIMKTALIMQDYVAGLFSSADELKIFYTEVSDKFDTAVSFQPLKPYLSGILLKSEEESGKFNYPIKEVFVISDFQKINFNYTGLVNDEKTQYYFINTSEKIYSNVSINKLETVTKLPEPSRPLTFKAVVKNHGGNVITDAKLVFSMEGEKRDEKIISLNPFERKEIEFNAKITVTGLLKADILLNIPDTRLDLINEDNSITELIYIPEKINIGVISKNSIESDKIKAVFDAANKITGGGKIYDYRISGSISALDSYDVIYICGFEKFSTGESDEIKKYLSTGKGVFLSPPGKIDIDSYNSLGEFRIIEKTSPGADLQIKELYSESPLFEGVFRDAGRVIKENDFEKVKVNQQYKIPVQENIIALITMQNGLPLMIESRTSAGSLILSSVSCGSGMSDFTGHALFAPVILKSAGYLSYIKSRENKTLQFVNHDTIESDLSKITESGLSKILKDSGIKNFHIINAGKSIDEIKQIVEANRKGKSYWLYTLMIAILLTALEVFLIKKIYREAT